MVAATTDPELTLQRYRETHDIVSYKIDDGGFSLNEIKEIKKQQVNTERNASEQRVFLFDGKTYDCDSVSVQRVSIAAQNALAAKITGAPFAIDWTLADNTTVNLDADGMLGVSQALAIHGATVHAIARHLKEAVDAAETPEEVEAIQWPEG